MATPLSHRNQMRFHLSIPYHHDVRDLRHFRLADSIPHLFVPVIDLDPHPSGIQAFHHVLGIWLMPLGHWEDRDLNRG